MYITSKPPHAVTSTRTGNHEQGVRNPIESVHCATELMGMYLYIHWYIGSHYLLAVYWFASAVNNLANTGVLGCTPCIMQRHHSWTNVHVPMCTGAGSRYLLIGHVIMQRPHDLCLHPGHLYPVLLSETQQTPN